MISCYGGHPDDWGFLLSFLDENDPRPAREQFDARHMGGWMPAPPDVDFDHVTGELLYPGDPPLRCISAAIFRNEMIVLFPGSWVLIFQADESWEAARMD